MEGWVPCLWALLFQPELGNGELQSCQSRTGWAGRGCRTGPGAIPVTFPRGGASPRACSWDRDTRKSGTLPSSHSLSQQGSRGSQLFLEDGASLDCCHEP